jgi:YD repeat-containing protein
VWASLTNADGHKTQWQFDGQGRILQQLAADGGLTVDTYTSGYLATETDPLGRTTSYTRDTQGYVTQITYPDLNTEQFAYQTAFHALTTYTNARSFQTLYGYDSSGHLISVKDALGDITSYDYLSNGLLQTVTTARGYTSTNVYDSYRRLINTIDTLNDKTTLTYDLNGNPQTTVDANGNTTTTVYDVMGRLVNTITPLLFTSTVTYNAAGEELSSTDPLGDITSLVYDSFHQGLVVQTLQAYGTPVQASTLETYDPAGLTSGSRNALGWRPTGPADRHDRGGRDGRAADHFERL